MAEILPENLNLFEEPNSLLAVSDYMFERVECRTVLDGNTPVLEFTANPDKSKYTDLNGSWFILKGKYVKSAGGANIDQAPQVGPVQNPLNSMFRSVDMWLNNRKITPPELNMHYIGFFNLFASPSSHQDSQLSLCLWYNDNYETLQHANQSDPQSVASPNKGLKKRATFFGNSQEVVLIGKLFCAPHCITRWFPPNCKFDWRMEMENYKFFTMQSNTKPDDFYRFIITGSQIWLKRLNVNPSIMAAHSTILQNKNMIFPCRYMESRTTEIPQNSLSFKFDNIFQGSKMPTSIYVMFIDSEAKNGHLQKNPYVFEHCNLSELRCYLGSHVLPTVLYKLNPSVRQLDMALLDTYIALGCESALSGPAQIIREHLTNGVFIAGFDLSRDNQPISNYLNQSFDASSVGLEGAFSVATQKTYTGNENIKFYTPLLPLFKVESF